MEYFEDTFDTFDIIDRDWLMNELSKLDEAESQTDGDDLRNNTEVE
ncbi:MAG: hypothetical protein IJ499_07025 [Clostridia bacterium]|nr:hypothetical protein [Clostridia bacterium]